MTPTSSSPSRAKWDDIEFKLEKVGGHIDLQVGRVPQGPIEYAESRFTRSDYILFGIAIIAVIHALKKR